MEKKSWQRPENLVSWLGLLVIGYFLFRGLDHILPLVNRVLENLVYTCVLAGVLATFLWLVVSKDLHRLAWYGYKMVMRWVTQRFVEIDPIAILHTYVQSLQDNLVEIQKALASLRAQARSLEQKIADTRDRYTHSMEMAAQAKAGQAKDKSLRTEFVLQARKAGRLEKSHVTYQGLLARLKAHIAVSEKIQDAAKFMIADIQDTVEEETEKRRMIQASHKAMSASRRILATGQQREMYDAAMEAITSDYYNKLGEIEQFMEDSQHFVNTMDLENGVFEVDALAKIEAWEKRSHDLLEGGTGKTKFRLEPALTETQIPAEEEQSTQFSELLKKL